MRPRRSRASGVRIWRRMVCFCASTCWAYCSWADRSCWARWRSSSFRRRMASSWSSSTASPRPRVLRELRVLHRELQEELVGQVVEELAALRGDLAAALLRLGDVAEGLELVEGAADDGTRALAGVVGGAPAVPPAAEL